MKFEIGEIDLAGILHYEGRNRLNELMSPGIEIEIILIREPNNTFDTNAIEVLLNNPEVVEWEDEARKLGYIPAKHSKFFAPIIDHGILSMGGYITTSKVSGSGKHFINVMLTAEEGE